MVEHVHSVPPTTRHSALYMGYAHAFDLPYCIVHSNATDGSYSHILPENVAETVRLLLVITYAAASTLSEGERLALGAAHRVSVDWDTFVTHAYDQTSKRANPEKIESNDVWRLHGILGVQ